MSLLYLVTRQVKRDVLGQLREPRLILHGLLFFIMILVFFPLTMPPNSQLLSQMAPGLFWLATLLSLLLSSERLFQADYETGVMEQWLASGLPLEAMVIAKLFTHWLLCFLPLLLFCPLLALLFGFSAEQLLILLLGLTVGTPCLSGLCALAAAFGSGMQQKGVFMALILFPLAIPVLIFGSGTVMAAMHHEPVSGSIALLLAMSLTSICFLPFAIAAIIRISLAE